MLVKKLLSLVLIVLSTTLGCQKDQTEPPTTASDATSEPVATTESERTPDPHYILERIREVVDNNALQGWSIARTAITWSTFTAEIGDTMTPESADIAFQQWTEHPTGLMRKHDTQVKKKLREYVDLMLSGTDPGDMDFDESGFRISISGNNGGSEATTFIRIAFMSQEVAEMDDASEQGN